METALWRLYLEVPELNSMEAGTVPPKIFLTGTLVPKRAFVPELTVSSSWASVVLVEIGVTFPFISSK